MGSSRSEAVRLSLSLAALAAICVAMAVLGGGDGEDSALALTSVDRNSPLFFWVLNVGRLGSTPAILAVTLFAGAVLAFRREYWLAPVPLLATMAVYALGIVTRIEVARPRPAMPGAAGLESASFPSVHAADSVTAYVLVAILLTPEGTMRKFAVVAALLVAFGVGISRVMLGHHWPSDVAAGWAYGAGAALIAAYLAVPEAGESEAEPGLLRAG